MAASCHAPILNSVPRTDGKRAGIACCDTGPVVFTIATQSGDGGHGLFLIRTDAAAAARALDTIVVRRRRQRGRQAIRLDRRGDVARRLGSDCVDPGPCRATAHRLGLSGHFGRCFGHVELLRTDFALYAAHIGGVVGRRGGPAAVPTQALARLAFLPLRTLVPLGAIFPCLTLLAGLAFLTLLAFLALRTVVPRLTFLAGLALFARTAIVAILALGARLAVVAVAAILPLATVVALATILTAGVDAVVAVTVEIILVAAVELVAAATLLLDPRTTGFEHAEIKVRELKVIFGVHPVAGALRIGGKVLVLFQQLRGVTTRAIVDAVAVITRIAAAASRLTLATATATAAGLTIVHQGLVVLSLPVRRSRDPGYEPLCEAMHRHRPPAMTTGRQWFT